MAHTRPPRLPLETSRAALAAARLYGILDTGYAKGENFPALAEELIRGGVGVLQIRAKGHPPEAIAALVRAVHPVTFAAGVPLFVNDFPELAATAGGEGVHVGQEDGPLDAARALAGPDALVGRSTHSLAQAEAAQAEGADYLGFGPLFATPTKPGRPAIGLEDIAEVHRRVPRPIFCIGGVKKENTPALIAAGARRVVIVSGLLLAADRTGYAREVVALLNGPEGT